MREHLQLQWLKLSLGLLSFSMFLTLIDENSTIYLFNEVNSIRFSHVACLEWTARACAERSRPGTDGGARYASKVAILRQKERSGEEPAQCCLVIPNFWENNKGAAEPETVSTVFVTSPEVFGDSSDSSPCSA